MTRDSSGSANTPTSAASHTRWRAPAVPRRSVVVAANAATSRSVALATKSNNGVVPANNVVGMVGILIISRSRELS